MLSQHLMIKDVLCVRKTFNLDSTYRDSAFAFGCVMFRLYVLTLPLNLPNNNIYVLGEAHLHSPPFK